MSNGEFELLAASRCEECRHFEIDHDPRCVRCGCEKRCEVLSEESAA